MIVKLQRPLDGTPRVFVYNQNRSVIGFVDCTPDMERLFRDPAGQLRDKVFYHTEWRAWQAHGRLALRGAELLDPGW